MTNREGRWETVSLLDQGYTSEGFAAAMARDVQTPADEAKGLVAGLTSLAADGEVVVGTLSAAEAKSRLAALRKEESAADAKGTVRFSINDGDTLVFDSMQEF